MTKNRRTLIIVTLILILASVGLVAFAMQPSARTLLIESLELSETVTDGHAVASFEFDAQGETGNGTVEVWGKLEAGPNGEPAFRVEVLEASLGEFVGVTAVSDGTTLWLYHPEQNKVLTGTIEEAAQKMAEYLEGKEFDHPEHEWDEEALNEEEIPENAEEAVDKLLQYVTAERSGGENINGSNALIIRLVPKPEEMPEEVRLAGGYVNLFLRSSDRALMGAELAESSAGYAKAMATTLEINQGIADSVFTFDIPAGAEVIQIADLDLPEAASVSAEEAAAAAEFDLLSPTALPDEAVLVDTAVIRGAVVQQYSLPAGKSFTIAQGKTDAGMTPDREGEAVTVRGLAGTIFAAEDGSRSLLNWSEDGVQVWVGGDVTPEQAMAIAESLK